MFLAPSAAAAFEKKTLKKSALCSVVSGFFRLHSKRWIDFLQWIIKRQYAFSSRRFYHQWPWSVRSLLSDFLCRSLLCAPIFSFAIVQTLWNIFHIHFCFRSICELIIVDSIILSPRGGKTNLWNGTNERWKRGMAGGDERERENVRKRKVENPAIDNHRPYFACFTTLQIVTNLSNRLQFPSRNSLLLLFLVVVVVVVVLLYTHFSLCIGFAASYWYWYWHWHWHWHCVCMLLRFARLLNKYQKIIPIHVTTIFMPQDCLL